MEGVRAQLEDVAATGRPRRLRVGLGPGSDATTIHCWMIRLAEDWVAVAVKAAGTGPAHSL